MSLSTRGRRRFSSSSSICRPAGHGRGFWPGGGVGPSVEGGDGGGGAVRAAGPR
ncbi:hypothetical protein SAZ11_00520 [Streptomyces sp. FXJ1.4098]|nr:hypothetical protein [Streptomyces sp. FXJ1.4098]